MARSSQYMRMEKRIWTTLVPALPCKFGQFFWTLWHCKIHTILLSMSVKLKKKKIIGWKTGQRGLHNLIKNVFLLVHFFGMFISGSNDNLYWVRSEVIHFKWPISNKSTKSYDKLKILDSFPLVQNDYHDMTQY